MTLEMYLTSFLDSNPTPEGHVPIGVPHWTPLTTATGDYMLMKDTFTMEKDFSLRWNYNTLPDPSCHNDTILSSIPSRVRILINLNWFDQLRILKKILKKVANSSVNLSAAPIALWRDTTFGTAPL